MWKIDKKETVFNCPWFRVEKESISIPEKRIKTDYFLTYSPDVVTIICLDPEDKILILREYKHGYGKNTYTFPSGIIEKGETPLRAAKRELLEETGYSTDDLTLIAKTFPNPTSGKFCKYTFLARGVIKKSTQKLDQTETIKVFKKELHDVLKMIEKNILKSDLNIASFFTVMLKLNRINLIKSENDQSTKIGRNYR